MKLKTPPKKTFMILAILAALAALVYYIKRQQTATTNGTGAPGAAGTKTTGADRQEANPHGLKRARQIAYFSDAPVAIGGAQNPQHKYDGMTFISMSEPAGGIKEGQPVYISGTPGGAYDGWHNVHNWIGRDGLGRVRAFCIQKPAQQKTSHFQGQAILFYTPKDI